MTTITRVSEREMGRRTGIPQALGFATKSGNILVRKGLDKATERRVLKHEADHISRGEEGPFLPAAIVAGGSIISGILGSRSNRDAARAQEQANAAAIAERRRQFDLIMQLTQPGRETGNAALNVLGSALIPGFEGIAGGEPVSADVLSDLAGNLPGGQAIIDETMRSITQGAAGGSSPTGGNVLAALSDRIGGFQSDRLFNALFQLAGFGPQATGTAANAASTTGANVGNLLSSTGISNASGILGAGQSQNNAIQNLLQFFALRGGGGGGGGGTGFQLPGSGLTGFDVNAIRGLRI